MGGNLRPALKFARFNALDGVEQAKQWAERGAQDENVDRQAQHGGDNQKRGINQVVIGFKGVVSHPPRACGFSQDDERICDQDFFKGSDGRDESGHNDILHQRVTFDSLYCNSRIWSDHAAAMATSFGYFSAGSVAITWLLAV